MGSASVENGVRCRFGAERLAAPLRHSPHLAAANGSVYQCLESVFHDPDEHSSGWETSRCFILLISNQRHTGAGLIPRAAQKRARLSHILSHRSASRLTTLI